MILFALKSIIKLIKHSKKNMHHPYGKRPQFNVNFERQYLNCAKRANLRIGNGCNSKTK